MTGDRPEWGTHKTLILTSIMPVFGSVGTWEYSRKGRGGSPCLKRATISALRKEPCLFRDKWLHVVDNISMLTSRITGDRNTFYRKEDATGLNKADVLDHPESGQLPYVPGF